MFRLDRYVVKRDPMGNVTHIVVKETVAPMMLPESVREEDTALRKKTPAIYTQLLYGKR